jgi:hypothetical protein
MTNFQITQSKVTDDFIIKSTMIHLSKLGKESRNDRDEKPTLKQMKNVDAFSAG